MIKWQSRRQHEPIGEAMTAATSIGNTMRHSTRALGMKVIGALDMAIALRSKAVAIAECNSTPGARKTGIKTNAAPTSAMGSIVVGTNVTTAAMASIKKQLSVFVDFLLLTATTGQIQP